MWQRTFQKAAISFLSSIYQLVLIKTHEVHGEIRGLCSGGTMYWRVKKILKLFKQATALHPKIGQTEIFLSVKVQNK